MEIHYLLLLPVTVTILLMVGVIANGRYGESKDRVLLALFGCIGLVCYITLRALVDGTGDYIFMFLDDIEPAVAFAICPLIFIYIRMVTKDTHWHRWYGWLFAPGMIIGVLGTILSFIVGWDRILEVRHHDFEPFIPAPDNIAEKLYRLINIDLFNCTMEAMVLVLIAMSICYCFRYQKHSVDFFANLEDSCIGKMRGFLVFSNLLLISTFLVTFFVSALITWRTDYLIFVAMLFAFLICGMAFNAYGIKLVEPYIEILGVDDDTSMSSGQTPENVESGNFLAQKVAAWEKREDKPFCREGLTVRMVADDMDVSPRALSVYINTQKGINFNRWINTLRVIEAKRMLLADFDVKIGYVSAICGFNDQAAFANVFRQYEGKSPQEFRNVAFLQSPNSPIA